MWFCILHSLTNKQILFNPQIREEYMLNLTWGVPQPLIGQDDALQPCAQPGCTPWPTCCQINRLGNMDYKFRMDKIK